jgi:hypothetical protein
VKTKIIKGAAGFIAAVALLSGAFFLAGAVTPVQDPTQDNSNNMNSMPGQGNKGRRHGRGNSNGNMNDNGNSNNTNNTNNANNSNLR